MSTSTFTAPATGADWQFNLSRHDEEPAGDGTGADDAAEVDEGSDDEAEGLLADAVADGDVEDDGEADGLGDAGKKALDRMKAERAAAKKEAVAAKKAALDAKKQTAELQRRVQEFEDRDKSELDKAQAQAERAKTQAAKAVQRAVSAEVRSLAVSQFADAGDAVDVLMREPSKYVDGDGDIDTDLIEADLADLLERKPHWAKPEPAAAPQSPRPKAKPDPGQGSRGSAAPTDFRSASREEVDAELAKYRFRQRL